MEPTEIILSFVISYIAGIIPTEWFSNHKSMKGIYNRLLLNIL